MVLYPKVEGIQIMAAFYLIVRLIPMKTTD